MVICFIHRIVNEVGRGGQPEGRRRVRVLLLDRLAPRPAAAVAQRVDADRGPGCPDDGRRERIMPERELPIEVQQGRGISMGHATPQAGVDHSPNSSRPALAPPPGSVPGVRPPEIPAPGGAARAAVAISDASEGAEGPVPPSASPGASWAPPAPPRPSVA